MPQQFLLVNPWIADVAAFNFWIRPLGLYELSEWLYERGANSIMVDCLSPFPAPGRFERKEVTTPDCLKEMGLRRKFCRYGISHDELVLRLKCAIQDHGSFDAVLVTSAISYWYPGVQWACDEIRKVLPGVPVILGGVYPTIWPEHAETASGADVIFTGALSSQGHRLAEILELPENPVRIAKRWFELGLHDGLPYSALRTARGCPFRCSYCASNIVSGGYAPRDIGDIIDEIGFLKNIGVREFAFYDDALLVDFQNRLKPVLKYLQEANSPPVFHTPNAMHARYIDSEVASMLYQSGFRTVRISLETINRDRQKKSGGKVENLHVRRAIRELRQAGYSSRDIGVYLLAALPGQDLDEVREGIEQVREMGGRPYLAELSPIPGTAVWNELECAGKVRKDMDPLLTNNSIFYEWSGFCSFEEFQTLKRMCI